jgi:menaquinone-specific isochorismate synthase
VEIIETQRHRRPDREELKLFLEACRDAAREDGHYKIASITLEARNLDPLAVLESIYERGVEHFYVEQTGQGWALAGAEAVVRQTFAGGARASQVRAWSDEVLAHTVAVGDLSAPFAGPHFYAGFAFEADARPAAAFAPATVFLPRWQVARRDTLTTAVANFRVDAESDLEALASRLWAAYEKFSTFAYAEAPVPRPSALERQVEVGETGTDYPTRVGQALRFLASGACAKVVLARAVDFFFDRPFRPLVTLAGLRERFPDCYAFSFENEKGQSFIGASPERLVRVADGRLHTEALAGTAARGDGAREDARLGQSLLTSEKDLREHAHVVDAIRRRLAALGLVLDPVGTPGLRVLPNLQHLQTPLTAALPATVHLLDIVSALHPTPAVGGVPREPAMAFIREHEPFARELYAGAIGYFDHQGEGEFFVGLRAGLVDGRRARLFAGAGIVAGSDPEAERRETELKFAALRDAIGGGGR